MIIGSARISENKSVIGLAGDQKQRGDPDFSGEVSMQEFYIPTYGWTVVRANDKGIRKKIGGSMKRSCNNPNIGYSQKDRYSIFKYGSRTNVKCNCDCSSLVRNCCIEAFKCAFPDFTTATEVGILLKTGKFTSFKYAVSELLYRGDILVTKGHTVVVIEGNGDDGTIDIDGLARRVIRGEFGSGGQRKRRLESIQKGLYDKVQRRVNELLRYCV